jgi:hypothetical protein
MKLNRQKNEADIRSTFITSIQHEYQTKPQIDNIYNITTIQFLIIRHDQLKKNERVRKS